MSWKEPDLSARQEAARAARMAVLAKFTPKPAAPASEVIPWDERKAERVRAIRKRQKPQQKPTPPILLENWPPPSNPAAKSYEANIPTKSESCRPEPLRFSALAPTPEFAPVIALFVATARSRTRAKAWKKAQWAQGNRVCAYCAVELVRMGTKGITQQHPRLATVDHRTPLAQGGDDAPWNFAMACMGCNNRKADMDEQAFRAVLAIAAE